MHRDLRPSNVLVSGAGVLKVTDFGTSRFLEMAAQNTVTGSPPYMAPEQFDGRAVFASDIYSLGVTMYQMATGGLPYDTPTQHDLARLRRGELVEPPRVRRPGLPERLNDVIMKALAPDVASRYPGADELLRELEGAETAEPRTASPPPSARVATAAERAEADQRRTPGRSRARRPPASRFCWQCLKPLHARANRCPVLRPDAVAETCGPDRRLANDPRPPLHSYCVTSSLHTVFTGSGMSFGQGRIWMNGKLVDWADAKIHIGSHVVHYGSGVFEGARCYETPDGAAVFRLDAHVRRLFDSAKIYRMDHGLDTEEFEDAVLETIRANAYRACYVRPLIYRGYHSLGVNPFSCPVEAAILVWEWGAYLGEEALEHGVDVQVSSWGRGAPNRFPAVAKATANYANSQLIKMEATLNDYAEGIALDPRGFVSEGSGQNIFAVRDGVLTTPPLADSILPGITRDVVITLARDLGIPLREETLPRECDVHRRRALLHRHRGRDFADSVGRQDHHRQWHPGAGHGSDPAPLLRRHRRPGAGRPRLASAGVRGSRGRCQRQRSNRLNAEPATGSAARARPRGRVGSLRGHGVLH